MLETNISNNLFNSNFKDRFNKIFYSCGKCNFLPTFLSINPYNNIIKHKCPIHGIIEFKLKDYFILLDNNLNNINRNYHAKCHIHPENNIICYNYEKQEYYCINCYELNKDKEYDIRFFVCNNLPNEINRSEIEFVNYNTAKIILYLKNKNDEYLNLINKYYNMIYLNNVFINSFQNRKNNNIDINNIKHYINNLKYYEIKEKDYINNMHFYESKLI